jgi:hypothetical protein
MDISHRMTSRSFLAIENATSDKVDELQGTYKLFKIVFERLDSLEEIVMLDQDMTAVRKSDSQVCLILKEFLCTPWHQVVHLS